MVPTKSATFGVFGPENETGVNTFDLVLYDPGEDRGDVGV